MTEKDAKKAIKEVSATTAKQIDRDFRIEEKLDKELLRLLDNKFLTRMECESYITLEPEVQHKIAQCYLLLSAVDVSNCDTDARERLLQECNSIHYDFIRAIDRARKPTSRMSGTSAWRLRLRSVKTQSACCRTG